MRMIVLWLMNIIIYLPELKPTNDFLLLLFSRSVLSDSYPMDCSTAGFPVLHHLPQLAQAHVHWVSHPLPPSIFPSIKVFSSESVNRIRWPKYWNFSFSVSLSIEYSGLISFRIDWLDLLVVQGTLKSLLQHYSLKTSLLWHSAFFKVQLLHLHMADGKAITLTMCTFVIKVMSLLFNILSRFVFLLTLG